MAVKTEFTKDDLTTILLQYHLGDYSRSERIQQGTVQTNYFLQTTKGKFVLRYYENRSRKSVLFESDLLEYLARFQYPCPSQIKNRQGSAVSAYNDKPYVIFAWVEGHSIEKPTARQCRQLIRKAAELQQITRQFRSPYTSYRMNYNPDLCLTLAQEQAAGLDSENARAKLAWLEHELIALELPPSVPKGICHCDFHFSNVLFKGDELAALLDFDDANYTYLQFDLVGLMEYGAWPHPLDFLDIAKARSIVREYEKYRPLSEIERIHLFDVYKLSILFDCVWYFSRGTANNFYEKRKIDALIEMGRQRFLDGLF